MLQSGVVKRGAGEQERRVSVRSTRTASWLAFSLAGLCVAMFLASIVVHVLAHSSQEPTSTGDTLSELLIFFPSLPHGGCPDHLQAPQSLISRLQCSRTGAAASSEIRVSAMRHASGCSGVTATSGQL